jgi:hypothetical protein
VDLLHRKIFDVMMHLGDVDTHALGEPMSAAAIGPEKKASFKPNPTRMNVTTAIA